MAPDPIVINEWLPHDMRGDNGLLLQERAEVFLESLKSGTDKIVVLRGSKWDAKVWALWTSTDVRVQVLSKLLYLGILIDPLKRIYLDPEEVQDLPPDLAEQVPADDIYLFQTAIAAGAKTIVTTDGRLINAVSKAPDHGLRLIARDDYYHERGL